MEKYNEQIVKSYNNWMNKITAIPDEEWEINYKKAKLADKRAGDKFEALCKKAGFNYIEVAKDLCNYTI